MNIREMVIDDYLQASALWKETPGIGLSDADSRPNIALFLDRNPGMSFVAFDKELLVGTIMAGHDGRRGYIYHLAVKADFRRKGIGGRLVAASLKALEINGIGKCHLFVLCANESGRDFWRHRGWTLRDDIVVCSKNVDSRMSTP